MTILHSFMDKNLAFLQAPRKQEIELEKDFSENTGGIKGESTSPGELPVVVVSQGDHPNMQ